MDSLKCIGILDKVVRGVESGRLDHRQEHFHCGSAHCIAGWYEVLWNHEFRGVSYNAYAEVFSDSGVFSSEEFRGRDHEVVISEHTGLDKEDLEYLFHAARTIEEIIERWEKMCITLSPKRVTEYQ